MKNDKSSKGRLFVTDIMKTSWKEFCGERKMPRSAEKFLRKFLRITKSELQDSALIFRLICQDQISTIYPSSVLAKQAYFLGFMMNAPSIVVIQGI